LVLFSSVFEFLPLSGTHTASPHCMRALLVIQETRSVSLALFSFSFSIDLKHIARGSAHSESFFQRRKRGYQHSLPKGRRKSEVCLLCVMCKCVYLCGLSRCMMGKLCAANFLSLSLSLSLSRSLFLSRIFSFKSKYAHFRRHTQTRGRKFQVCILTTAFFLLNVVSMLVLFFRIVDLGNFHDIPIFFETERRKCKI